jgi:hypothetical protein
MRNMLGCLLVMVATAGASSAAAVVDAGASVIVRTYDSTALPPADRQSAIATAAAILGAAGLDVEWRSCGAAFVRSAADPCLAPLGANELALRLVTLAPPPNRKGPVALGDSHVDTQARGGSLATVYVNRVAELAHTCRVDVRTLLGRTIAHEIGHLLLGTRNHAAAGLMRAVWSAAALQRGHAGDWLFTPHEASLMRDAVRTRAA